MPVQVYVSKGFDSQKTLRYFQERAVSIQKIDLGQKGLSPRELESVRAQVGLDALIDRQGKAFLQSAIRFSDQQELIVRALLENPSLLRAPIVRFGKLATVGYCPQVWDGWDVKSGK